MKYEKRERRCEGQPAAKSDRLLLCESDHMIKPISSPRCAGFEATGRSEVWRCGGTRGRRNGRIDESAAEFHRREVSQLAIGLLTDLLLSSANDGLTFGAEIAVRHRVGAFGSETPLSTHMISEGPRAALCTTDVPLQTMLRRVKRR
jgi:hypothetical protein